ncbi:MAG: hypothetical protein R2751_10320 [Bacteroidales bacterium]
MNPRFAGKTSLKDNMAMVVNAGVDQMGSETENQLLIESVREGVVSEERIDQARTDPSMALCWACLKTLRGPGSGFCDCAKRKNQKNGYQAQLESLVLLTNDGILPAQEGIKVYAEGMDKEILARYATVVDAPADAGCCSADFHGGGAGRIRRIRNDRCGWKSALPGRK